MALWHLDDLTFAESAAGVVKVSFHSYVGEGNRPLADQFYAGLYGADFESFIRDGADHVGELQAWDLNSGEKVWTHELESGTNGSVLATGGGLVFLGGGDFQAFNALSGKLLWQIRTNYGRTGVPTTYAVNGVQYIAVQSGAHPAEGPQGGLIWVFALDCQC